MKRTKISGQMTVNKAEVLEALFERAKVDNAFLKVALDDHLRKRHRISLAAVKLFKDNEGRVMAKIKFAQEEKVAVGTQKTYPRLNSIGFAKKNVGFYYGLSVYLDTQRRKKKKHIAFDQALAAMVKKFPSLDQRRFSIYIRDKRQQANRGFTYDSLRKEIVL